ncbi:MAG: enoyl-CoA hydratase/isomerase family protein [Anaerolineae bacterium]|nr:enoyl-CoA hydratase/isomerase family protein [Anaerolineae bacterium]
MGERIRLMINEDDRAGQYLWHHHAFYLAYASQRVPEITDSLFNVDNAQKWGFAHKMGPFEIWDAIGVRETVPQFEAAGYPVADWVKEMLEKGYETFYQTNDSGKVVAYYSPQTGDYVPLIRDPREIRIADLKAEGKQIWSNGDGNIYDMGDGVLLWEFATKGNTITTGYVEAGYKALELLEENDDCVALVIGNEANDYGFGANLDMNTLMASGNPLDVIEEMLESLQQLTLKLKYGKKPTIAAPSGRALGGSCEMIMAANAVVAHVESYMGQTEVGIGLVPAGGGCKELVRRVVNPVVARGGDARQPLRQVFETLATAKVAESAMQARELGFIADDDKIVMNRDLLLGLAKEFAIGYAKTYEQQAPEKVWASGRDVYAAMLLGLEGFREAGFASDHDKLIGQKLAKIVTGGALAEPQFISQQVFLNLEKQVFKELITEQKTMERIMHTLSTGKPLRN